MENKNIFSNLIKFAIPYLVACFLQTFYGLADLYITGQFNGADAISAVSVGSQVMHMVTVVIVGFVMGTTVLIGRAVGSKNTEQIGRVIGNSFIIFSLISLVMTIVSIISIDGIISLLAVPEAAIEGIRQYLSVCFIGIIFISAYNVICGIYRGLSDTKTPMYFVAIAGVINICLDYVLIGIFGMGAFGAALATVFAQALSVIMAIIYSLMKVKAFRISKNDFTIDRKLGKELVLIGFPIALQEGFVQVSFLIITIIANMRGLETSAAVGIVEKIISFLFLVPSAMLSAVSALSAICMGSGKHKDAKKILSYGVSVCIGAGLILSIVCVIFSNTIIGWFANGDTEVVRLGTQYLKSYVFDCAIAGVHFCFGGYFCAYGKAYLSFINNAISIVFIRIPGAYYASKAFPDTLFVMGMAAPLGSLLSSIICVVAYIIIFRNIGLNNEKC